MVHDRRTVLSLLLVLLLLLGAFVVLGRRHAPDGSAGRSSARGEARDRRGAAPGGTSFHGTGREDESAPAPRRPEADLRSLVGTVRGRVVDEHGRGVAGARVGWWSEALGRPDAVRTDTRGRFSLGSYSSVWGQRGACTPVLAVAEGYVVSQSPETFVFPAYFGGDSEEWVDQKRRAMGPLGGNVLVPHGGEIDGVVVRLRRSGVLRVRVVDAAGRPVAGADVEAERGPGLEAADAVTGEDGCVTLRDLPAGRRTVAASGQGARVRVPAVVSGDGVDRLEIALPATAGLPVRVVDEEGRPAARAHVLVFAPVGPGFLREALTAEDGTTRFVLPRDEEVVLRAMVGNRSSPFVPVRPDGREVGLRLGPTGTLVGRPARRPGDPSLDRVSVSPRARRVGIRPGWGRRMPAEFRLEGRVPGLNDLEITDPDGRLRIEAPGTVRIPAGGEVEIVYRVHRPATIRGTVRRGDGTPVPGLAVTVGKLTWPRTDLDYEPDAGPTVATDLEGRFEAGGLPPGEIPIRIRGVDPETAWIQHDRVVTAAPGETVEVSITLGPAGALSLGVVGEHGEAVASAAVRILDGRAEPPLETDAAGFVFRGSIPPGPVAVEVEADGFRPERVTIAIRAGEVARRIVTLRPR